ncbi:hypothetical protein [Clostridium formicaceticum]|uniref:Uncharacterized protein n=1 Tax=Clostridium formicaceticum TaxID=1497 RepID=A0AAC9RR09_9CLOT|nr:hypothetical protein [Clostridium formicaceticum]AOY74898.1 hypothetical protein BJL90_02350 [Clostridium formicaceticum]ARE89303.1 hypothetical protein CLFO_37100 [Clostridium formicaceticum]
MVFFVIFILLLLTIFDLPFLLEHTEKKAVIAYIVLIFIGIAINYIVIQDIPVTSPAVLIARVVGFILGEDLL